jgi:hypothetical protein
MINAVFGNDVDAQVEATTKFRKYVDLPPSVSVSTGGNVGTVLWG